MTIEAQQEIQATLKELVKKHLPAAIGEELQELLSKGEAAQQELKQAQAALKSRDTDLLNKVQEINLLRADLMKHEKLKERELAVQQREDRLAVDAANTRAKHAEDKLDLIENLTRIVFKEPHKVLSVSRHTASGGQYDPNTGRSSPYENKTTNETHQYIEQP